MNRTSTFLFLVVIGVYIKVFRHLCDLHDISFGQEFLRLCSRGRKYYCRIWVSHLFNLFRVSWYLRFLQNGDLPRIRQNALDFVAKVDLKEEELLVVAVLMFWKTGTNLIFLWYSKATVKNISFRLPLRKWWSPSNWRKIPPRSSERTAHILSTWDGVGRLRYEIGRIDDVDADIWGSVNDTLNLLNYSEMWVKILADKRRREDTFGSAATLECNDWW